MTDVRDAAAAFRRVAALHPERTALLWSASEGVTFAELDRLSDRAARFLRERGVDRGDRVGVRLDKTTLTYAVLLGCLKLGAPYFLVDPANPAARADAIVAQCAPKVLFWATAPAVECSHAALVPVDAADPLRVLGALSDDPLEPATIAGTDPAYVMFTSGSTGTPKGAVMSHGNLLRFVAWTGERFRVTPSDVFTNVNPLHFDNSVFDVYASLFHGAALVPFDAATIKDPYRILERIGELRCTVYFSVPSLLVWLQTLRIVTPESFPHARVVAFGGEGYPKPKLRELFESLHPRVRLVNVYGPTECTCICSAYDVSAADVADSEGYAPLGELLPDFTDAILDEEARAVAPGETGELWLGGPCVGLGYLGEPDLTRAAFRQNPTHALWHDRMYRTGDLVRRSAEDGKLRFVGRRDSQVKHQGYRIELGEVEHALARVGGVDEAVALHAARDGVTTIVAVVAARGGVAAETVRRDVAQRLPAYMVPGRVHVLERLPKNANGKIDRNLLRARYG